MASDRSFNSPGADIRTVAIPAAPVVPVTVTALEPSKLRVEILPAVPTVLPF